MKWTINNQACVATWSALLVLDQTKRAFATAETVKIGTFPMWAKGESAKLRAARAKSLAVMLDNIFRKFEGAAYEPSSTRPQAINATAAILVDDEKTIAELANVVDDSYHFAEEDS